MTPTTERKALTNFPLARVYVPGSESGLDSIAPKSAIVGRPDDDDETRIVVYYEGNTYGASNMRTFADRTRHAYERMRDHYPTIAIMYVPRTWLRRVGTYYPDYGMIEPVNTDALMRLARWLEIDPHDLSRVYRELRASSLVSA